MVLKPAIGKINHKSKGIIDMITITADGLRNTTQFLLNLEKIKVKE